MDTDTDEPAESARVFALAGLENPGDIERVEEDGRVRYTNVKLLAPGKWTDAESRTEVNYSADGIQASVDNWEDDTVNLLHDVDNDVSEVGSVDTDEVFADDRGNLYGPIVLDMDSPASEYADQALQSALESGGAKGLGGPSVEIAADRLDDSAQPPELVEATFSGLGLVKRPASKPVDFARQTAERAVALSGADSALYTRQEDQMDTNIDTDELRARLSEQGVELGDDLGDDDLRSAVGDAIELENDEEEDGEDGDDSEGNDEEPEDDPDDDEEGEPSEMEAAVEQIAEELQAVKERLQIIEDETEQLRSEDADLSDIQETLEDLADAERVDSVEERLEALEDEPEEPNSLADAQPDTPQRNTGEHTTSFGSHGSLGRSTR